MPGSTNPSADTATRSPPTFGLGDRQPLVDDDRQRVREAGVGPDRGDGGKSRDGPGELLLVDVAESIIPSAAPASAAPISSWLAVAPSTLTSSTATSEESRNQRK